MPGCHEVLKLVFYTLYTVCICYGEGYFYGGMHRNTVAEVLSQKVASQSGLPEHFFLASIVTNTYPFLDEFLVTAFQNLFSLEK